MTPEQAASWLESLKAQFPDARFPRLRYVTEDYVSLFMESCPLALDEAIRALRADSQRKSD